MGVLLGSPKLQAKHQVTVGWATSRASSTGQEGAALSCEVTHTGDGVGRHPALLFPGCVALVSHSTSLSLSPHLWWQKCMLLTHGLS